MNCKYLQWKMINLLKVLIKIPIILIQIAIWIPQEIYYDLQELKNKIDRW